jgi:hypothetical protein
MATLLSMINEPSRLASGQVEHLLFVMPSRDYARRPFHFLRTTFPGFPKNTPRTPVGLAMPFLPRLVSCV